MLYFYFRYFSFRIELPQAVSWLSRQTVAIMPFYTSGSPPSGRWSVLSTVRCKTPKPLRLCVPQKLRVSYTTTPHGYFNNGLHRKLGIVIRHTLMDTDHRFAMGGWNGSSLRLLPRPTNSPQAVGPLITQALLLRRRSVTPNPLRLCVQKNTCVQHTLLCVASTILSMPTLCAEFSYPEGVERLIGQGWREATTLSNGSIGIIELCRSSAFYELQSKRCIVGCGRPLNSYRVHPSGASVDTVGTSCLPSVAIPANRALSSVYPLQGKRARSDGCWAPPLEVDNITQNPSEGFARASRSPQMLSGASPRPKAR